MSEENLDYNEEINYLEHVKEAAQKNIDQLSSKLSNYNENLDEHKHYIWENIYEMDAVEKASNVSILSEQENTIQRSITELESLKRFIKSPYFGRIDFSYEGEPEDAAEKCYIGIRGLLNDDSFDILVYDWRAPLSGMFYNYDEGPASYEAPQGKFEGIITKKKQYKIENGKLVFQIRSSLKIDDEILQNVLSRSADSKMRNIVSTIQRDQNKIIRNDEYQIMIVQGVAGSGKTSVALHRIAYILYTFRDKIKSDEILIVSPNHLFSDYVSNILPELGESNIKEMSFYDLVRNELRNICAVEDPIESNERIITGKDDKRIEVLDYKLSADFFADMVSFFKNFTGNYIKYEDVSAEGLTIKSDYIKDRFDTNYFGDMPYFRRFEKIVEKFSDDLELSKNINIGTRTRKALLDKLKKICLKSDNILNIYNDFLRTVSEKIGLNLGVATKKKLKIEDALPLVYFKFELMGYSSFNSIKHIVIDEMQDYSYIHFEILKRMFRCKMTILGDVNQVLRRRKFTVLDVLQKVFGNAHVIKINKTYRSTFEITSFASNLIGIKDIEIFNRHGQEPEIFSCSNRAGEITRIAEICHSEVNRSDAGNIAIICKTVNSATAMYDKLIGKVNNLNLCVNENSNLENGITVITNYLAKGLEFDTVIIPDVDSKNYVNDIDRQILYISCTRALHRLYLLHAGKQSPLLANSSFDKN